MWQRTQFVLQSNRVCLSGSPSVLDVGVVFFFNFYWSFFDDVPIRELFGMAGRLAAHTNMLPNSSQNVVEFLGFPGSLGHRACLRPSSRLPTLARRLGPPEPWALPPRRNHAKAQQLGRPPPAPRPALLGGCRPRHRRKINSEYSIAQSIFFRYPSFLLGVVLGPGGLREASGDPGKAHG